MFIFTAVIWFLCFSAQKAALHQELHPHEPFCVVHLESYISLHQRRRVVRPGGQRALLHTHCEYHKHTCTHVLAPLMLTTLNSRCPSFPWSWSVEPWWYSSITVSFQTTSGSSSRASTSSPCWWRLSSLRRDISTGTSSSVGVRHWAHHTCCISHLIKPCYLCFFLFVFCAPTGTPTLCVTIWAVLRLHFDDIG